MTTLKPLDDRVVIEVLNAEEKTAGGIVLPGSAQEKPRLGKVKAVGKGKLGKAGKRASMSVKVGDTVFFGQYAGTEVSVGKDDYKILRESEILAKKV